MSLGITSVATVKGGGATNNSAVACARDGRLVAVAISGGTGCEWVLLKDYYTVEVGADVSAANADSSYNIVSTWAIKPTVGHWISVTGFTGDTSNNVCTKVVTSTTQKITVEATLADDAAGETVTIIGGVEIGRFASAAGCGGFPWTPNFSNLYIGQVNNNNVGAISVEFE